MAGTTASSVQMNFRIDPGCKERADEALREAGITPSRAVRALWQFIDEHSRDTQAILDEVSRLEGVKPTADEDEALRAKLEAAERASGSFTRSMLALGVSEETMRRVYEGVSDDELVEEGVMDHHRERGLL